MMKKLKDICEIQYGYAFDSKCFTDDSAYPQLARIRDVKRGYSDTYYSGEYSDEYVLSSGDLLVGMDGEFNISKWMCDGALLNQRVCKLIPKSGINKEYLRFAMSKALKEIENRTSFVTVKHLSAKELNKLELIIPIVDKQNNIADSLVKLENIINKRQQELDKLDELVKARFVEMFGDVVSNTKNWKTYTWNDVLVIKNGKNQKNVENNKGIYPICGSGGIMSYADDYITESNSVIIGRKGNINNPILMREKFWNVDTAFGLEPNTTILNVDYLFMFCSFFDFEVLNKAVTIPSLTKADLLKIIIPIPPIELQNKFATFVKQIDKSKVAVQKALDEAQLLFDSLMQEYFG